MPLIEFYGLLFEWHDLKLETVYKGREITFDEVCSVFFDDYEQTFPDVGHYDEPRMITVGMSSHARLLTVVWVARDDVYRIITAFEPSHNQKRSYNNARTR
jgi:uncharacterized DUF497 family protein